VEGSGPGTRTVSLVRTQAGGIRWAFHARVNWLGVTNHVIVDVRQPRASAWRAVGSVRKAVVCTRGAGPVMSLNQRHGEADE